MKKTFQSAMVLGIVMLLGQGACSSTTTTQTAPTSGGSGVGGSQTGGEGAGATPHGGAGGARPTLCDEYCAAVMGACTDDLAVYGTTATCLAVCAALPPGSPGDELGNSVHCRWHEADLAGQLVASERAANCARSGPIGNGTCGSSCEGYCTLMSALCPLQFDGVFQTLAACQTACLALPDLGEYDLSMSSGSSVQCRAWHVSSAAIAPTDHCGHAGGDPPCADP